VNYVFADLFKPHKYGEHKYMQDTWTWSLVLGFIGCIGQANTNTNRNCRGV